jgi:uncharacterized coiled-coil protein SlyX
MEALDQLNSKLDLLLKKYAALQAENTRLSGIISQQSKVVEELNKKLTSLEQSMVSVHLGTAMAGDEDKENMRKQLDHVITEIDKILNTLND